MISRRSFLAILAAAVGSNPAELLKSPPPKLWTPATRILPYTLSDTVIVTPGAQGEEKLFACPTPFGFTVERLSVYLNPESSLADWTAALSAVELELTANAYSIFAGRLHTVMGAQGTRQMPLYPALAVNGDFEVNVKWPELSLQRPLEVQVFLSGRVAA